MEVLNNVNVCCVEVSKGEKDGCAACHLGNGHKIDPNHIKPSKLGNNCCISRFVSGNLWHVLVFQEPMSVMALAEEAMAPILICLLRNIIQKFRFSISRPNNLSI